MSNLLDVPQFTMQKLFGYLPVRDILNLRATCSHIFEVSRDRVFYERIQIYVANIKEVDLELYGRLGKEFAPYARYNFEGCSEEQLNLILPHTEEIKEILVNIKRLNYVCMKWRHVNKLIVNFVLQDNLKEEDIDFSYLSMLSKLRELTIKGTVRHFQTLILYQSILLDIILNSKQLSRLCFRDIVIEKKNSANDKIGDSVRTTISNADHIKEWSLLNVYASDFGFFPLPRQIRALELRNNNCVSFKSCCYDHLEKLVLEGIKFDNEIFSFPNLKKLEIIGDLLDDGLEGRKVICPQLKSVRLYDIHHIEKFRGLHVKQLDSLDLTTVYGLPERQLETLRDISEEFQYSHSDLHSIMEHRSEYATIQLSNKCCTII